MALSANSSRTFRNTNVQRFKVAASQTIWKGAGVGVKESDGLAYEYDDASGMQFVGFASKKVVTNSSGFVEAEGVPEGYNASSTTPGYVDVIKPDEILDNVTVTGVAAQTDMFAPVFMSDDDTFTLTPNAAGAPVGMILQVRDASAAKADVMIFNFANMGQHLLTEGGYRRDEVQLRNTMISTALTFVVASLPLRGAGYAKNLIVVVGRKSSGHTGDMKFQVKLNGTFLKFSTTNKFTFTDTQLKVQGGVHSKAIAASANNKFADGELLEIKASVPTRPTQGFCTIILESVRRLA